jgi:hypothetical protein
MTLSAEEERELERELHRHAIRLEQLLESPEYWTADLHVPLAVQLRVLLCDRELPVLLTTARHKNLSLRIWGPHPPLRPFADFALFVWTALIASWSPVDEGHKMSIDEYLNTQMIVVSTGEGGTPVTPAQVIKWVANKEGGAHFSLDKPRALKSLKESKWQSAEIEVDSLQAKQILHAIGVWTHSAIGACLGVVPRNDQ